MKNASTLERRLRSNLTGDVLFDAFSRGRYATDASFYQIMPAGVVVPRTMDEALSALATARDDGWGDDRWADDLRGLYDDVTALLLRLGGTPSGEHGDGRLRAGVLAQFFGPELVALFGALKRSYDPHSILNPGVILPAAGWQPLADLKVGAAAAAIPDDIAARLRDVERSGGWAVPKPELAR